MSNFQKLPSFFKEAKEDLSIEQTNEIRRALGLRPIPHENSETTNKNTNDEWLSSLKEKSNSSKVKVIKKSDKSSTIPSISLGTNIEDIQVGRDTILTLKDQSILQQGELNENDDEYEDILEQESIQQDKIDIHNYNLKQMNKARKRNKTILNVTSADIDESEKYLSVDDNGMKVSVGATMNVLNSNQQNEIFNEDVIKGKVKVVLNFDEQDATDYEAISRDFQPVKIKKRKRNDDKMTTKRIKLPSEIKSFDIIDEDKNSEENDDGDLFGPLIMPIRNNKNNVKSSDQLIKDIEREKLERIKFSELNSTKDEAKDATLTIGGNTSFMESLSNNVLENIDFNSEQAPTESSKGEAHNRNELPTEVSVVNGIQSKFNNNNNVEIEKNISIDSLDNSNVKNELNFYDGVASTLKFLSNYNSSIKTSRKETGYEKSQQMQDNTEQNTKKISSSAYNPSIKLVYKDEDENELTTKEAYKQLSQRFHGTKSNKNKIMKNKAKIIARNNLKNKNNIFDI
ncbi:hypothetical protein TPHA_0G01170 [Tetrapisispora phaffii CBS 4417]|uniref:Uncharacterized protein n=1 Tax=Tetrapisispora phaffii (strain ATCC 24235 / CBS 4417 / NBRC 1672 / NRRL Y-8282 / UCD 70-5) TaxID=1071381 RepID=G8BVM6_TETPH|nr:hypothetical protein TPHA_0G01170 [Tetrapisispora phaffii CBS 4417]CCE63954.1 hypothetical protein TPHA_0G01170 [Tetrapisispora phaffii CBS 4417]